MHAVWPSTTVFPPAVCLARQTGPLIEGSRASWRIAPEPFLINPDSYRCLQQLGNQLLAFYSAANRLYRRSVRGTIPPFFHEYLDIGKSDTVIEYGRMNRFRRDLPARNPARSPPNDGRREGCRARLYSRRYRPYRQHAAALQ